MLAYVRDHDAILWQAAEEFIEETNCRLRQSARIKFSAFSPASYRAPATPIGQGSAAYFRVEYRNRIREVTNHRQLTRTHAIKLCRINFKVDDLGMRREARGISGHTIIQPRSKNQQQVSLVQSRVGGPGAVHAHHAQVIRRLRWHRAQSVDCRERGDIQIIE